MLAWPQRTLFHKALLRRVVRKKEKKEGEARSLRREGEGPRRKTKAREERKNYTGAKTVMGGSLYSK